MNLHHVKEFMEYDETKLTKRIIFKEGASNTFLLNFMPGQELPPHKHPNSNVHLLVLTGEGTFRIDENEIKAKEWDALLCTAKQELSFVNDGEKEVSLYVVLSNIPDERYAQDI
ncbi:cupin domain-containing protein [Rubeoparvulum massiliense]|uniref:cupin domain-containing protein n=1 Tax=Rubeoparvulum massiliense TaxID=1631346 RepID=UPI00065E179A|nr:cupin domain-containing protein [Rubeoparvulum massiliense]